ncbi:MAG: DUF1036 domain-containing protein [Rhizobiales bacterium]|nr:DUF1036 domain-containing protein [Hyphomicrobiales bacterium]
MRPFSIRLPWLANRSCRPCALAGALACGVGLAITISGSARADFRLCNNTGSRVGIAIGYKDGEAWITEGWWNLSSRSCETILRGSLSARYYYIYGVDYDRGGEWSGKAYMCTRDKEFTIRGIEDCLARGFDRTGFFEVDTQEQKSWTVQLTESADQAPSRPLQPQGSAPGTSSRGGGNAQPIAGQGR